MSRASTPPMEVVAAKETQAPEARRDRERRMSQARFALGVMEWEKRRRVVIFAAFQVMERVSWR